MAGNHRPSTIENGKSTSTALSVAEDNVQPYHHFVPLQDPTQTFRVLKLLSKKGDSSITATLHEKWLDEPIEGHASKHLALSYEWGDAKNRQTIEVDGQQYLVRRNLHDYLTTARDKGWLNDAEIFIDAICIDQENTEKNHQVSPSQMSRIYSRAAHVVVWLGPSKDGSDKLFEMYNANREDLRSRSPLEHVLGLHYGGDLGPCRFVHDAGLFLTRTYWQRLWIVPEILLAERVTLYCGDSWVPLNANVVNMADDIRMVREMNPLLLESAHSIRGSSALTAWSIVSDYLDRKRAGFLYEHDYLISMHRERLCADPRDHVYALLSVGAESDRGSRRRDHQKITVDYNGSAIWLFFQVMANVWPENILEFGSMLRTLLKLTTPISPNLAVITEAGMSQGEFNDPVFQVNMQGPYRIFGRLFNNSPYQRLTCYAIFPDSGTLFSATLYTRVAAGRDCLYLGFDRPCLNAGLIFRMRGDSEARYVSHNVSSHECVLVGCGVVVYEYPGTHPDGRESFVPNDAELKRAVQRLIDLENTSLLKRLRNKVFKWDDTKNICIDIDWLDMLNLTKPCEMGVQDDDYGELGCLSCIASSSSARPR